MPPSPSAGDRWGTLLDNTKANHVQVAQIIGTVLLYVRQMNEPIIVTFQRPYEGTHADVYMTL